MHNTNNLFFLCGDFNLHCSFWDEHCDENLQIAWDLISQLSEKGLSLVNNESIPTFYWGDNHPQVNDLIWIHQDAYLHLTIDIKYNVFSPLHNHQFLDIRFGNQSKVPHSFNQPPAEHRYLKANSDAEGDLILEVLQQTQSWATLPADLSMRTLLAVFQNAWTKFSSVAPIGTKFNHWWNNDCSLHKNKYIMQPTAANRKLFHAACKQVKKDFFAKNVHDMIENNKPWEGTGWIKQRALPKVPQLCNSQNAPITSLDELFSMLHTQFDKASNNLCNLELIHSFPLKPTQSFPPFSKAELEDAIKTCSNSLAPSPSYLLWKLLKIFLKDDEFTEGFLRLSNNCIFEGIWPAVFKSSHTIVIPKPGKASYMTAKN